MFSYKANAICMAGMTMPAGAGVVHRTVGTEFGNPDSSLIMPDFDLTGELSLKIKLHMLRPITEKVHSGNGPVSLVPQVSQRSSKLSHFEAYFLWNPLKSSHFLLFFFLFSSFFSQNVLLWITGQWLYNALSLYVKGTGHDFCWLGNLLIIFRSKEIHIYFKTNNQIPNYFQKQGNIHIFQNK